VATANSATDKSTFEETAKRIRELNEKLIQLAKESGQASRDTYEKALQSLLDFEKATAGHSQLDWVKALANTHVKFVQDITSTYLELAREALK